MSKLFIILAAFVFFSCKTTTYFIVRHGEKEGSSMTSDPELTAEGGKQAQDIAALLKGKSVTHVYATNYKRTMNTAAPTATEYGLKIEIYDPRNLTPFVQQLKMLDKGTVLVVSHSNVVDDVVNGLMGKKEIAGDLPETEYGMAYIVKKKRDTYSFMKLAVPKVTPRN
jgi:broad specificity phosphatase PhoE